MIQELKLEFADLPGVIPGKENMRLSFNREGGEPGIMMCLEGKSDGEEWDVPAVVLSDDQAVALARFLLLAVEMKTIGAQHGHR